MKGMPDVHHFAANPRAISNLPQTGLMLLDWILHPEHDGLSVSQIPLDQASTISQVINDADIFTTLSIVQARIRKRSTSVQSGTFRTAICV
jgi:hypothetical protein